MADRTGKEGEGAASPEGERIAKRLARAGIASRREVERMIADGRVRLNGRRLATPAVLVGEADRIEVDGRLVGEAEPPRLWRYHKPAGLVTTARDEQGRPTVFDRLPESLPRVMSVGRLDLASEGLLLLTNDGELKRRLELPSTGWLRRYRVRVHGSPTPEMLAPLERGIEIEGERFQPMQVAIDRQQGANAWLTVGLREGRNREIRRAMEAVGLGVNRLIRVSYGPFQLGDLAAGAVDEIKPKVLADQLGLPRGQGRGGAKTPSGAAAKAGPAKTGTAKTGPAKTGTSKAGPSKSAARPAKPPRGATPGLARKTGGADRGRDAGRAGAPARRPGRPR